MIVCAYLYASSQTSGGNNYATAAQHGLLARCSNYMKPNILLLGPTDQAMCMPRVLTIVPSCSSIYAVYELSVNIFAAVSCNEDPALHHYVETGVYAAAILCMALLKPPTRCTDPYGLDTCWRPRVHAIFTLRSSCALGGFEFLRLNRVRSHVCQGSVVHE